MSEPVDYSEFEEFDFPDGKGENPLQFRVECLDRGCDWMNRRTHRKGAKDSAESHERHHDHETVIEHDGGPEWAQEGDDE